MNWAGPFSRSREHDLECRRVGANIFASGNGTRRAIRLSPNFKGVDVRLNDEGRWLLPARIRL
jgi:hypothetical protein